ncbi:MAG: hypothetical protein J6I40_06860, partial [Mailhella sp.]|nr:hypothetical protein [Mailhella sp.]
GCDCGLQPAARFFIVGTVLFGALSRNIETTALDTLYERIVPLRQPFRLTPQVNAACVPLEEAASPH